MLMMPCPRLLGRRVGGREAVARNAPLSVIALPEDEELLICLRENFSKRTMIGRARRIRADIRPCRGHYGQVRDSELDVEFQLAEDGVVGCAYGVPADRRLAVRRHKNGIF